MYKLELIKPNIQCYFTDFFFLLKKQKNSDFFC